MSNYNERLDKILGTLRQDIKDSLVIEQESLPDEGIAAVIKAKQAINTLILGQVIGEDESDNGYDKIIERMIKDEQRARIRQMTTYNEGLDDLLAAVYLAGTENGLSRRLTDAKEIVHRKKAFINGNHVSKEAKQAILHWVADEVIGEDISLPRSIMPMHSQTVVNIEKRKQREALAKYGYKGGEK